MAGRGKEIAIVLLRGVIGSVFIYAGVLKALDPVQFAADVDNFRLLPHALSCAVGVYLPWLEILAGAAMIFGIWRAGASVLLGGMLMIFFIALSSAWARGLDIRCGCFGLASNKSYYPLSLLIDAALFAGLWVTVRHSAGSTCPTASKAPATP